MNEEKLSLRTILALSLLVSSCGFVLWYLASEVLPNYAIGGPILGYDPYRYHLYALGRSQYELLDILMPDERGPFEQMGYPTLLSLVYGFTTPDPLVGCLFNWLLWLTAGLLLAPLARSEGSQASDLPFLALWLLYPESIDWNATTSKEPLVAFAVACALRTAISRRPMWAQALICAGLAGLLYSVRLATVPLIVLSFAISVEFRGEIVRRGWYKTLLLAIVSVVVVYVAGGKSTEEGVSDNPLVFAGHSGLEQTFSEGLSENSILTRAGSSNRFVDSLWVPVRGVANIVSPIYLSPLSMVDLAGVLQWLSAVICSAAALAIALRLFGSQPWTRGRAVASSVLLLGLIALGLSGIIHTRYRSLVVAALLPLGIRSWREEVAERGFGRIALGGAVLPALLALLYRVLRQAA